MPATSTSQPFSADHWHLRTARGADLTLTTIDAATAGELAPAVIAIDPWRRMGYANTAMTTYLTARDPASCRRAIRCNGEAIGAVSVRYPWLRGPYLELLAILPEHQSLGAGAAILAWMAQEVAGRANSLWVCTSTFNARALSFYGAHGFARVGDLDELVGPGFTEVLLRKRL